MIFFSLSPYLGRLLVFTSNFLELGYVRKISLIVSSITLLFQKLTKTSTAASFHDQVPGTCAWMIIASCQPYNLFPIADGCADMKNTFFCFHINEQNSNLSVLSVPLERRCFSRSVVAICRCFIARSYFSQALR